MPTLMTSLRGLMARKRETAESQYTDLLAKVARDESSVKAEAVAAILEELDREPDQFATDVQRLQMRIALAEKVKAGETAAKELETVRSQIHKIEADFKKVEAEFEAKLAPLKFKISNLTTLIGEAGSAPGELFRTYTGPLRERHDAIASELHSLTIQLRGAQDRVERQKTAMASVSADVQSGKRSWHDGSAEASAANFDRYRKAVKDLESEIARLAAERDAITLEMQRP